MRISINFEVVDADMIFKLMDIIGGNKEDEKTAVPSTAPKLTLVPTAPKTTTEPIKDQVPVKEQAYTQEQLALAATPIIDSGRSDELVKLLHTFGVNALTQLPEEQYGAFATALRGLGAKI